MTPAQKQDAQKRPAPPQAGLALKEMLRPDEAARLLNVSRWTVYRWVRTGKLQASKIGPSSLRIFRHSIEELIARERTG